MKTKLPKSTTQLDPEAREKASISQEVLLARSAAEGKEFLRFLRDFVRSAAKVALSIIRSSARPQAGRPRKAYAALLSQIWDDSFVPSTDAATNVARLEAAYFTLRSFLTLVRSTTVDSRAARARCEAALLRVGILMGDEMLWDIESRVEAELKSKRIKSLGDNLRRGPGSMAAWKYLASLPTPPPIPFPTSEAGPEAPEVAAELPTVIEEALEEPAQQAGLYKVWFGTNRALVNPLSPKDGFANERDPQGTVHYGICTVSIPRSHRFGSVGSPFFKRWLNPQFQDDHLVLKGIKSINSEQDFLTSIAKELNLQEEKDRVVLVYIHGYNNTFEEAAIRAAQIGFDLKVPGITALYSWPSLANPIKYLPDRERIEGSEKQIADFLTAIATKVNAKKVHVIAHSMGNRGFARAIERITTLAAASPIQFGQIILAAADLDIDLFRQLAMVYPNISDRTSLYVSAKDKALWAARLLQEAARAGFKPPVTVVDGVDTIDVTNVDLTLLGHGYISEAAPVLNDIHELMEDNTPPLNRTRTEAAQNEAGKQYWVIRK